MSPSSKTPSDASLKQGKLSFGSTKRTSSAAALKSGKKVPPLVTKHSPSTATPSLASTRPNRKRALSDDPIESSDSDSGHESPGRLVFKAAFDASSDVDLSTLATSSPEPDSFVKEEAKEEEEGKVQVLEASASAYKRRRIALPKPSNTPTHSAEPTRVNGRVVTAVTTRENDSKKDESAPRDKLDTKNKAYKKLLEDAQEKMDTREPIHADKQTPVHHILRVFDLSYEYGPCIGVTRLQRWERANALGLNPPSEVHVTTWLP
jgi:DNA polymerase delta subunit 4